MILQDLKVCDYPYNVRGCHNQGQPPTIPSDTSGYVKDELYEQSPALPSQNLVPQNLQPALPQNNVHPNIITDPSKCPAGSFYKIRADCTAVGVCKQGYIEQIYCPFGTSFDLKANTCIESRIARW